jgi:hypothetical protein
MGKNRKKWKPISKSKRERMRYSTDKGVRGWVKNKERFEDACQEKKREKSGHVYIISLGMNGLYKIGHTYNIEKRMKDLSASNPFLKCVWSAWCTDARELERIIHERLGKHHIEREIFKLRQEHIMSANRTAIEFREVYG